MGWFYRGLHRYLRAFIGVWSRTRFRGIERVPREGPVVVAIRHETWWDPIIVARSIPRPMWHLGKKEVFRGRFLTWLFSANGVIPVDRKKGGNDAAVQASLDALAKGYMVGIYPEGTRAPLGAMLPGKTGAVRLALLTGAPIVPVGLRTYDFWPKGATLPRFGKRTYVLVGEPRYLGKDEAAANDPATLRKLTDDTMAEIARLCEACDRAYEAKERWRG
jgi:1-acyl-sn-glycerol-3-phosphate acyltransferase